MYPVNTKREITPGVTGYPCEVYKPVEQVLGVTHLYWKLRDTVQDSSLIF